MRAPVVILAGGSSDAVAEDVRNYSALLIEAFRDFEGTLISGGTRVGVSALAGDVRQALGSRITTIGYAPEGVEIDDDGRRYSEVRRTAGKGFSALEAVEAWRDILRAGVPADEVALLGIGGGEISEIEYLLGVALGARCGLVRGSGGAVDTLLDRLSTRDEVEGLSADAATIRSFLGRFSCSARSV